MVNSPELLFSGFTWKPSSLLREPVSDLLDEPRTRANMSTKAEQCKYHQARCFLIHRCNGR